ncbi:MAG: DHH family phosphoesterase [Fervidicoccaceae archaeon]
MCQYLHLFSSRTESLLKDDTLKALSITHTDLDGVASSAAFLRSRNIVEYEVVFTEPDSLHSTLNKLSKEMEKYELISITDLGPNPGSIEVSLEALSIAKRKGKQVIWIDHHIWDKSWIEEATSVGIELEVDTSTCATGIASRYSQGDSFLEELSRAVCSADEWRFDDENAPWLVRFVGFTRDIDWLRRAHKVFMDVGSMKELLEKARPRTIEVHDIELRYSSEFLKEVIIESRRGIKVAFGIKREPEVSASLLAQLMLARFDADIAAILNEKGKLEFRSNKCNVREIAFQLGGGGHPKASGAPVPVGIKTILPILPHNLRTILIASSILKAAERVGCIPV